MRREFKLMFFLMSLLWLACKDAKRTTADQSTVKLAKGLYSYGPEIKSFADCDQEREYWVVDSAGTLELAYTNFNFEKPYEPVYVEVECKVVRSDSLVVSADFDSTMIVTKVLKITKDISMECR